MKNWVRALLDPTDIVQSPSSAKKQITPPPKFDLPVDESAQSQRRSRRSVSPSKKSSSPRKSRQPRTTKDAPSTPSTTAANENLQKALEVTASTVDSDIANGVIESVEQVEVMESTTSPQKTASPEKKSRKSKKDKHDDEKKDEEEKVDKKEEKKTDKKKKKETKEKEAAKEVAEEPKTTISLDVPITLLPAGPSAADTEKLLAEAKEIVEESLAQTTDGAVPDISAVKANKRKPEDDDEETSAEAAQRAKKAKVLEEKLKRERVRNRALFGVSAAFALA